MGRIVNGQCDGHSPSSTATVMIHRYQRDLVVLRSYHEEMSNVVKRSMSFPVDVFEAVEEEARRDGVPVSAVMTEAARSWLTVRRGLRAVADYEAEHGAFTAAELKAADRDLDRALKRKRP